MDPDHYIQQLAQPGALASLHVLMGDEPLLLAEAGDALRASAQRAGYSERRSLVMDALSDWSAVKAQAQAVSLFGDKRLLEIKLPSGKPGKMGGEMLVWLAALAAQTPAGQAETLLAVHLPRLDRATRVSKWAGALLQSGLVVDIQPIERSRLADWIGARLARQRQRIDPSTLVWMADKVEGNLLAAHQEIIKLGLLYPEGPIDGEDVKRAVLNVARYDVFGLRDAMLAGDPVRCIRMLQGLRAEGEALPLVLWAVGEEIRILARLAQARQSGQDVSDLMRKLRVFGTHEKLALQALARVAPNSWPAAVRHAHEVDRLIKGLSVPGRLDDPWEEMQRLALRVAVGRARLSA